MSRHDDILGVPFIHLGHAAADDLLAPARERVHTHDGVPVDAPHMDGRASAGHDVPLRRTTVCYSLAELRTAGLAVKNFQSLDQWLNDLT